MKMHIKLISLLLVVVLLCGAVCLMSCNSKEDETETETEAETEAVTTALDELKNATDYGENPKKLYDCLVHNLKSFKNPSSVILEDAWYPIDSKYDPDWYLVKIHAQNGFGGYDISWYKITSYSIVEVSFDEIYRTIDGVSYWGKILNAISKIKVNNALKEYISLNY